MLKSASQTFVLDNFAMGLDWASAPDKLSPMSLYDAKNINLTSYRALEKRYGMTKLYATPYVSGQSVRDIYEYVGPSATYVLVASNTATEAKVGYYASGAWNDVKTGLTKNKRFYFASHNQYCFVTNGVDANFKIRGTTVSVVGIVAPTVAPTLAAGDKTGLEGRYYYKYCYKRSTAIGPEHRSNPSAASASITATGGSVKVTVTGSDDPQVDYIEIYRTLGLSEEGETSDYYLVTTIANPADTATYDDNTDDDNITAELLETNTVPPKSYFCLLHKDRMIYGNCPDETDGDSLFMFSEIGRPESVPSTNYQYFDRKDGQEITGIASLPDYLVIFKKNKIAAMEGDFEQWYTVSATTGCLAPWAITTFQDKIMFLSAEGWKVTDGRSVQDVSKKLIALNRSQYISYTERLNYCSAYYPTRKQILFLMNHSSYTKIMMVGHLLSALYSDVTQEETMDTPYIGWTYHQYDNHTLTALGRYTDANGVEKVLAGDSSGYIYLLDDGNYDDASDIAWKIETGWHAFGMPIPVSKQLRMLNIGYSSNDANPATASVSVAVDSDFTDSVGTTTLTHGAGSYSGYAYCNSAYAGIAGMYSENIAMNDACIGKKFRFRLYDTSSTDFTLLSISVMFRLAGLREGI